MFFKYLLFCLLCISPFYGNCAQRGFDETKVYIDEDEMKSTSDAFYIHLGNNMWMQTNTVHRDSTGLYTYQGCIAKSLANAKTATYEKKWRCPYCYNYWPVGTKCQNAECPSKYNM